MTYLLTQIALFLIAAGALGLLSGWMLRSIKADEKVRLTENQYQEKMQVQDKYHQQEVSEFAEAAKKMRAEVTRLATNNKALRETIDKNNSALALAQEEISQLSFKLSQTEQFHEELARMENADGQAGEFDKTVAEYSDAFNASPAGDTMAAHDDAMIDTGDRTIADVAEEPNNSVEITMGNLWSNIKNIVGGSNNKK